MCAQCVYGSVCVWLSVCTARLNVALPHDELAERARLADLNISGVAPEAAIAAELRRRGKRPNPKSRHRARTRTLD